MTRSSVPPPPAPWYRRLSGLMPFRIREILLVSSEYDAFVLEEDGPLTERLFSGYSELNLTSAPRITHARTVEEARALLAARRFDLVLTVVAVEDGEAADVASAVAEHQPQIPAALLVFDEADLERFEGRLPAPIERAFVWSGDARTLIAAIKLEEDARNVTPDTEAAGVQVILVVEDSVRAYSRFLGQLYPELMRQSQSLIAEGGNPLHRLLRMRARPRILLASDYESALALATRYRAHLFALISDIVFPRGGALALDAGLELVAALRALAPDLPVLLLSAEDDLAERAAELEAWRVAKGSDTTTQDLRTFLAFALGFGDFVFRTEAGVEVGRASNVYEMEQALARVPASSIRYHGLRHHFSVWLRARGMFDLATRIRPRSAEEFEDDEALRRFLIEVIGRARAREETGTIHDVDALPTPGSEERFVRVGTGSIGGKGRGLAFVNRLIARYDLLNRFEGLQIRIPRTVVLGADEFERFRVAERDGGSDEGSDRVHLERSLAKPLSAEISAELRWAVDALQGPLAVRSSSVLEDARFRPFAGVYATYMLPDHDREPVERFRQLEDAVRGVYASVFSRAARTYIAGTPHALEDERMAVVIQQVVGERYPSGRFYPAISGVAQSYDFYPTPGRRPDEGVAHLALGLGHQVVGGGAVVRFCPRAPDARAEGGSARQLLTGSQSCFYAVDERVDVVDLVAEPCASLRRLPLSHAEEDGVLPRLASTYDAQADVLRDSPRAKGPRVVTFSSILRHRAFPLAEAITLLLDLLRDAMGSEVEIELAVDTAGVLPDGTRRTPRLYVLQLRPLPPRSTGRGVSLETMPTGPCVVASHRALGDGRFDDLSDVIYVRQSALRPDEARAAAADVRRMARSLRGPFVLIGPGRWGTSDPHLGIPITWRDIVGVRVLVETPMGERHVEPSQGSHFFRNLVADRVAYLSVAGPDDRWDPSLLDAAAAAEETALVRRVHLEPPLRALVDGRRGRGVLIGY